MKSAFDVAVVGLGAMGSAAIYHLSKAGASVIGFDQHHPPHTHGSTHGETRITRLAIGEGAQYVPLVSRSHQLWRELEQQTGKQIFNQCGGLVMANQGNPFLAQTKASALQYSIPYQGLSGSQISDKFPVFAAGPEVQGIYEPSAGFLRPEVAVESHLKLASKQSADLHFGERVKSWSVCGGGYQIETGKESYFCKKLVICAGPWVRDFFPEGRELFKVYRQLLYWFAFERDYQQFKQMPVFIWEFGASPDDFIYGFPAINGKQGGIKIATEIYDHPMSPDDLQRKATASEKRKMIEQYIKPNLPGLMPTPLRTVSCWYTNTSDNHFIIDSPEGHRQLLLVSACSGHGFKHSAAIGEAVAQWADKGRSEIDLSAFGLPS